MKSRKRSAALARPVTAAKRASLRYVTDQDAGISRVGAGNGFVYRTSNGRPVRNRNTLARIHELAIPPAWTAVWICPRANGHLQATGRDAKGRKQYIYHPRWRAIRDEAKYGRMSAFAAKLPRLRRRVSRDLARRGISREKVLASIVRLLETTLIRVGNEEYARATGSFGLTTFKNRHAEVHGDRIEFRFRGKSGKHHTISTEDPRIARVVKRCQDLPGHDLFEYLDDEGKPHNVTSEDVNNYLHEITGEEFTAKDFRTWAGSLLAASLLRRYKAKPSQAANKRSVLQTVRSVAERLGNTASICRKCYIHPSVLVAFENGSLAKNFSQSQRSQEASNGTKLRSDEAALLRLISEQGG